MEVSRTILSISVTCEFFITSKACVRFPSAFFIDCFLTCESVHLLHRAQASALLNAVFFANE